MAVDIRFFKVDGTPLSLDKVTGGIDFGVVRKNQQQVLPVIVKNLGTDDAKNVYVTGSPLNTINEVTESEYNKQHLAGTWKTFSMLPDSEFSPILYLPNILAGKSMLGKKKYAETFTNPSSSLWKNDTLTGHTWNWTGSSVVLSDASGTGKVFGYINSDGWGNNKDIDFTFQTNMPATSVSGSAFIMVCLRKNSLGDNKGYLINIKRTTTTVGGGTCFFEVRKGAGLKSDGTSDYGTILASTQPVSWSDFMNIRIKLWNNASGQPEIKIWVNNVKDTDPSVNWGSTTVTSSWIDTTKAYIYAGGINFTFGSQGTNIIGSNTFEIRYASLLTEDLDGKVYIKTIIGDGAEDSVLYNSAMELYYDPV